MRGGLIRQIDISMGVSGFGDVEDGVQGIQGFLIPGGQQGQREVHSRNGNAEGLGKRKRDDSGIAKFFPKKEDTPPKREGTPPDQDILEDKNSSLVKEESDDTYVCSQCQKQIPLQEMEVHDDYHVALELSERMLRKMILVHR